MGAVDVFRLRSACRAGYLLRMAETQWERATDTSTSRDGALYAAYSSGHNRGLATAWLLEAGDGYEDPNA